MKQSVKASVGGRTLELTNLDKVLYPETGFTKGQVIDYYRRVGEVMVPHLAGRPLTMKRYPDGVEGEYFFEKECPYYHPDWLHTVTMESANERGETHYCVVGDLGGLVWVANLASLEMHVLLSRGSDLDRPTLMAFDIDPGAGADLLTCARAARELRKLLHGLGLDCFPKSSGGKGLHLYVPLNTAVTFDDTKRFAHAVAKLMEQRHPDLATSVMRKELRKGKVLLDWSQNDHHKTTVCVYSLRARPRPMVSTPLMWREVDRALKGADPSLLQFEAPDALARVEKKGDLFADVLSLEQKLPAAPSL